MNLPVPSPVQRAPKLVTNTPTAQFGHDIDKIESPAAGGGGGASAGPFDVNIVGTAAKMIPGTINGLLPSNYGDTFTITNPGTFFVVLSVTASDGQLASAAIAFNGSAPAAVPVIQGQPPTSFDYLLGIVVDGVWYRVIAAGSLAAVGGEVFRVSKISPAPGTLPYDIYYTWNVTTA